jgi:ribonuclease P protein component
VETSSGEQSDAPERGAHQQDAGNQRALCGQGFPKQLRLSGREEFALVFDKGTVATDRALVVHAIVSQRTLTRIGLSISKRVGTAPTRNYWKRCIREAFRKNRHRLPSGLDVIIRPRRDARANYHQIENSLVQLLKRLARQLQHPQ